MTTPRSTYAPHGKKGKQGARARREEGGGADRQQTGFLDAPHRRGERDDRSATDSRRERMASGRADHQDEYLQHGQHHGEALQDVDGKETPPALLTQPGQVRQLERRLKCVAEQEQKGESAQAARQRRPRGEIVGPVSIRRECKGEPRQQEEQA